jgi:DNA-binding GntR family transcriptional regulator
MERVRQELQRSSRGVSSLRDRLRDAIVAGEIPADSGLTQAQLADRFEVSRTPLREALRMLELENLIVRESNGRFRAATLSAEEFEQLAIIFVTLEAAAVRLTVPDLTPLEDAALEGLLAEVLRLTEVEEWSAYERAHRSFHMTLAANVGPMHTEQLERVWDHSTRYRQAFGRIANAEGADSGPQREHRAILDAAESRDPEATSELIARHHAKWMGDSVLRLEPDRSTERLDAALDNVLNPPAAKLRKTRKPAKRRKKRAKA